MCRNTPGVMHIPSPFHLLGQLAGGFSVAEAFDQSAFAGATEMGVDFMEIPIGGCDSTSRASDLLILGMFALFFLRDDSIIYIYNLYIGIVS